MSSGFLNKALYLKVIYSTMENYKITLSIDKKIHHFEIGEYPHHNGEQCKYKVYQGGELVASFEPDRQNILHVCQNQAGLDEELLHLLADQIEARHPHNLNLNDPEPNFDGTGIA
jgi:hypothetical protein